MTGPSTPVVLPPPAESIPDALAILLCGNVTGGQITDRLARAGAQGVRWDPYGCPVAVYLAAATPDVTAVAVGYDGVSWWRGDGYATIRTPPRLADWLDAFDAGQHAAVALPDTAPTPEDTHDRP